MPCSRTLGVHWLLLHSPISGPDLSDTYGLPKCDPLPSKALLSLTPHNMFCFSTKLNFKIFWWSIRDLNPADVFGASEVTTPSSPMPHYNFNYFFISVSMQPSMTSRELANFLADILQGVYQFHHNLKSVYFTSCYKCLFLIV